MAETGCDALGLDWTTDIADARRRVGHKVALQGNMDPSMLYAPGRRIEEEVATILAGFGEGEGHVFNLGHGIHQDVPPEHAGRLCGSGSPSVGTVPPLRNGHGSRVAARAAA
ncbi:Uroporphyrinogen decarboxylase [Kluyvera cryocrescens]|uniref:Uroporphyrinogen decarboxylase n=1 Tax=Kluyvera cryocrescens TaxID=580 RepID=A0A485BJH4_KLUCR|nr:Uroporphyrinogen decarboxylase [Kluyvera cryocrescens]